jgi:DNA-binding MarR family transcriptional regulator
MARMSFDCSLAARLVRDIATRYFPPIKTRDIAAHTQMDRAHVTRVLADLIARGLVTQIVDRGDRRLRVVDMTAAGRAIMASTLPFMVERQERLERCLGALELRILWKVLSAGR